MNFAQAPQPNPMISKEIELETLFNKNQLHSRLKREFVECGDVDFSSYMVEKDIDPDFGIAVLVQMALHKRTTLPTLIGLTRNHFDGPTASQQAADMILKCAMADLIDWNPTTEQFIVRFEVTEDTQRELDMYQFPLPMVTAPKALTKNTDTPYMVVKDGSVILRNNHHNDDVCLDHINRMNQTKFAINNDVARMVQNQWRNLDKPKEGETKQDFERRKRAFEKFDRTAKQVMGQITELGNEFYLTHKYDKRGRTYCQGYHVSYQGAPWNKAVIELAPSEQEIIP